MNFRIRRRTLGGTRKPGIFTPSPGSAAVPAPVRNPRISRLTYAHRCVEGVAVEAYRRSGTGIEPGMKIWYVVRDARRYIVDTEWDAGKFDPVCYRGLLEKAWGKVEYAFSAGRKGRRERGDTGLS